MFVRSISGDALPSQTRLLIWVGLILTGVSALSLLGAWGLEIFGGYTPCPLCLEQRIPYYVAVPGGLAAAILAARQYQRASSILLGVVCLLLLYNMGLGIYHAGAEWKFWAGPATCGATQDLGQTTGNLLKKLQNNRAIPCDQAALRIFGLSLAGYSVLISAALSLLGALALFYSKPWRSPSRTA